MKPLEEIIESDADAGKAFWDDCTDVFSSGAGARVLKRLCEMAHPLNHTLERNGDGRQNQQGRR